MASKKTTSNTSEVGIAKRLWIKFHKESIHALYNPFLVSLASGNLSLDSFRHYISQDFHFLKAFARAYELAEECCDDDDAKVDFNDLRKSVLEELKMHDSFVQEWGSDPTKENNLSPATVKYTDFLLATASGKVEGVKGPGKLATPFEKTKVAAYTLGATTPCMRLYAFLGKELQQFVNLDENSHPYKKWIDNYSCTAFQASALQTEDLLDRLSVTLTGEELNIIENLYYQAMKLEIELFSAQPLLQPTVLPLTKDQLDNQIARMPSADLRSTWGVLSGQYTEEYEQCIETILLRQKAEKFNYDDLSKALEQLSDFEEKANTRVIESGVLKGLYFDDIKRAGERLILQDGCPGFFKSIIGNENWRKNVHVLSYCWCGDLIRSAFSSVGLEALNVHANEFTYEESASTGEIIDNVHSPMDKVQAFKDILHECSSDKKNLSVYIGDSVGDLLCLLEADVGIVVGSSSSLRRVGSHFGVSFVPLFPGLVVKQKNCTEESPACWKGLSGTLYTVESWAEINAFILGK
ncbi:bifunctional TH2 protein, mitochondrial-like [Heracleum sosnowskyi]|uniref:Bifunctional TH2 protein, mitochondrial-like n=1 Tax=Heracleum sosnowskyi TaxID=360622 RepID=A0AAD8LZJ8_9APIA|nr:bifunctional TH2 protein, mitochondrial-like [Heracleum sosnowskyi]